MYYNGKDKSERSFHMYESQFHELPEKQQNFLLNWLQNYLQPCEEFNYEWPAMDLKYCFGCLFFYVTREQFVCAMQKLGFQSKRLKNRDFVFNVDPNSKMFTMFQLKKSIGEDNLIDNFQ